MSEDTPSRLIDSRIEGLADWRGERLARLRALIKRAVPDVGEEWKWRGMPVWSHAGMICTGETYKSVVKLTFPTGAALKDPAGLFNAGLDGNKRRDHEAGVARSSRAGTNRSVNARPTRRGPPGFGARALRSQTSRSPCFSSTVVSVAVVTSASVTTISSSVIREE